MGGLYASKTKRGQVWGAYMHQRQRGVRYGGFYQRGQIRGLYTSKAEVRYGFFLLNVDIHVTRQLIPNLKIKISKIK